jgi:two-component system, NtrC family, sensor kinase
MKQIWHFISFLGLKDDDNKYASRSIIITNRLNFILFVIIAFLNIITAIVRVMNHGEYSIHTKKLLFLLIVCIINGILSYLKFHKITKLSLIFLPTLLIVFIGVFFGYAQETDIVYDPLIIIAASFIPQLILAPRFNNLIYTFSLLYFFVQLLFLDTILFHFALNDIQIISIEKGFHIYYKSVLISAFMFIHITMYYLRNLNYRFEQELNKSNKELKNAMDELRQTQQHLIQSEKMASLGTLTAGVAHEINNPLNFINGGINILLDNKKQMHDCLSNDNKERFELAARMINDGYERTSEIVKALMTFSHRGTSRLVYSNINKIIDNTLLFLNSQITGDIEIKKKYQFDGEIPIYPGKIHQVIMNLLDNALYAVKQNIKINKVIEITTYQENHSVIISVENNGDHIPEGKLNQIFDPFYTTKDPGQGTGLGLAISYTLISEHKGKIYAQNLEKGVAFIVELPLEHKV